MSYDYGHGEFVKSEGIPIWDEPIGSRTTFRDPILDDRLRGRSRDDILLTRDRISDLDGLHEDRRGSSFMPGSDYLRDNYQSRRGDLYTNNDVGLYSNRDGIYQRRENIRDEYSSSRMRNEGDYNRSNSRQAQKRPFDREQDFYREDLYKRKRDLVERETGRPARGEKWNKERKHQSDTGKRRERKPQVDRGIKPNNKLGSEDKPAEAKPPPEKEDTKEEQSQEPEEDPIDDVTLPSEKEPEISHEKYDGNDEGVEPFIKLNRSLGNECLLFCVFCQTEFEDEKTFFDHVTTEDHIDNYKSTRLYYHNILRKLKDKHVMAFAELLKEDGNEMEKINVCDICYLEYIGSTKKHRDSREHKALKHILCVRCTYCDRIFESRLKYEIHSVESSAHRRNRMYKLLEAGVIDDPILNIPNGSHYIKDVEAYFCPLCEEVFQLSVVPPLEHCKTKAHYEKFKAMENEEDPDKPRKKLAEKPPAPVQPPATSSSKKKKKKKKNKESEVPPEDVIIKAPDEEVSSHLGNLKAAVEFLSDVGGHQMHVGNLKSTLGYLAAAKSADPEIIQSSMSKRQKRLQQKKLPSLMSIDLTKPRSGTWGDSSGGQALPGRMPTSEQFERRPPDTIASRPLPSSNPQKPSFGSLFSRRR